MYFIDVKPRLSELGCLMFKSNRFEDNRGSFYPTYNLREFNDLYRRFYSNTNIVLFQQDNISFSKKNVVRGMHFQTKRPQGKLVRVLSGKVIDVVIDIRKNSKTFGKIECFSLSSIQDVLYVPEGFAHGFWALEDTLFGYKCTDEYDSTGEGGISPFDEEFNFPWLSVKDEIVVSPKDGGNLKFKEQQWN